LFVIKFVTDALTGWPSPFIPAIFSSSFPKPSLWLSWQTPLALAFDLKAAPDDLPDPVGKFVDFAFRCRRGRRGRWNGGANRPGRGLGGGCRGPRGLGLAQDGRHRCEGKIGAPRPAKA
jgi:hypothetical protein